MRRLVTQLQTLSSLISIAVTSNTSTPGGYRNAGRNKGGNWPSTLEEVAARDAVRQFVVAHL